MKPHVLFIICDDLTYGDLSLLGNPHIRTPRLDTLGNEGLKLTRYCSGPLCTPARAALMTGRHPYRTGATETYIGRSMLHHDEVTLAQMLKGAGYDTGLFGKWHLGDCYPMRPCDKGFDESLWHRGGGLRQYANVDHYEGRDGYFDPLLTHHGELVETKGYCTDLFTDAAIQWIHQRPSGRPWFSYVAYNAPHTPLEIGDEWLKDVPADLPEPFRRVYAMVRNIDHNVGKLLDALPDPGNTLVVFTSDHGLCPSARADDKMRFNASLRSWKGSMYEGGLRVPCLIRWTGVIHPDWNDTLAHPIDWVPTFASVCGFALPTDRVIDGVNQLPVWQRKAKASDRRIPMQWHRGDAPRRFHNAAVLTQQWKWYRPDALAPDELYDIPSDPGEACNLAAQHPDIVASFIATYESWFEEMAVERPDPYTAPRIVIGHDASPTTYLTLQDARLLGTWEGWATTFPNYWLVDIHTPGRYRFDIHLGTSPINKTWTLRCGTSVVTMTIPTVRHRVELQLHSGKQTLTCLSYGKVEDLYPGQPDPGVRTVGQIAVTRVG